MTTPAPGAAAAAPETSYDPIYFDRLFAIEDRHFWFRARSAVIATVVRQVTRDLEPGYCLLEIGCGTGVVLRVLERVCGDRGRVIGMDLFAEGLRYARRRTSCPLVQADVGTPPFAHPFEVIGLFDVLEHLPEDRKVLDRLNRMLAPGGRLLLTVPAHPTLWSYFDEASHHCRRYRPDELRSKLAEAGYEVEYLTQYMAALFPLVWLGRRLAALKRRGSKEKRGAVSADNLAFDEMRILPGLNGLLTWVLAPERWMIALRRQLPLGTSLLAVARKKEGTTQ